MEDLRYLETYSVCRYLLPVWLQNQHVTLRSHLIIYQGEGLTLQPLYFQVGPSEKYEVIMVAVNLQGRLRHSCYLWLDHDNRTLEYYDPHGDPFSSPRLNQELRESLERVYGYSVTIIKDQKENDRCSLDTLVHLFQRVTGKIVLPEEIYERLGGEMIILPPGFFNCGAAGKLLEYRGLRRQELDKTEGLSVWLLAWSLYLHGLEGSKFCEESSRFASLTADLSTLLFP